MHPLELAVWVIGALCALRIMIGIVAFFLSLFVLTMEQQVRSAWGPYDQEILRIVIRQDRLEWDELYAGLRRVGSAYFYRAIGLAMCFYALACSL